MGATTQAAFVQSMLVVFAGGRTGLSTLVTGASTRGMCLDTEYRSL